MLQTFEATLENGHIIWNNPTDAPKSAKVLITVLEEISSSAKKTKGLARFAGIWKDLPEETKNKMDLDLKKIRNEWERDI